MMVAEAEEGELDWTDPDYDWDPLYFATKGTWEQMSREERRKYVRHMGNVEQSARHKYEDELVMEWIEEWGGVEEDDECDECDETNPT